MIVPEVFYLSARKMVVLRAYAWEVEFDKTEPLIPTLSVCCIGGCEYRFTAARPETVRVELSAVAPNGRSAHYEIALRR